MLSTASRTRRIAALAAGVALAATGIAAIGAGAAAASDGGMLASVNASRASHGLKAYAWNSHLASVAAGQARRMADQHKLYHNPNLASEVGGYRWVGENVGYGPNSDVIETAFMNSAPHRANILDKDYTQIGIASVEDSNGRLWVAQVFRQPSGSGSSSASSSSGSSGTSSQATVTKKRTTTHRTHRTHRVTRATSHRSDATASTPAATPAPVAKPRTDAKPRPRVARPAPQPTLAQRVSYATSAQGGTDGSAGDPIADTLAFAATMNAIAG